MLSLLVKSDIFLLLLPITNKPENILKYNKISINFNNHNNSMQYKIEVDGNCIQTLSTY